MSVLLFLSMRVLHVVLAAAWFGAAVMATLYLGPAVEDAGAGGGQVIAALVRRGFVKYMASIGGLTVLTGVYLFWRFTSGFDPALSASRGGMAFSIGALCGVIALAIGGSMIGASFKKMVALGAKAATLPDGAERAAITTQMTALGYRADTAGRIVVFLLLVAMAAMALGHYI